MATMITEVYDALIEAGASQEKARAAAAALAGYENRFAAIERDLAVVKWMVGTSIVLMVAGFGVIGRGILEVLARLPGGVS